MKHRKLRIAWSVMWGIAALLLIAMWVRSSWFVDIVFVPIIPKNHFFVESYRGRAHVTSALSKPNDHWNYFQYRSDAAFEDGVAWSFVPVSDPLAEGVIFAFWPFGIGTALLSIAPWLRWQFSLRTLLIATTLVAVGLGLIVWL